MHRLTVVLTTAVVACVLCLGFAAAQEGDRILLRNQWNAGDEITWQVTSETTGVVTMRDLTQDLVAETTTEVWTRVTMPMSLVIEAVDAEGNGTVSYRLGPIDVDTLQGGQQQYIQIDPEAGTMTVNGEEQPIPGQMVPGLLGDMKLVFSPRGELLDMTIPEGAGMGDFFGGMDMEQLMRLSQQSQMTFPEEPVSQGYSWAASTAAPFGEQPDAQFDSTAVLTLAGFETVDGVQCARLEMVGAMDIAELPMGLGGGTGPVPEGMEMVIGPMHISMEGSFLFDLAAGKMVSGDYDMLMDMHQHITGTAEGPEGPQAVDTEIIMRDLLIETTVTAL